MSPLVRTWVGFQFQWGVQFLTHIVSLTGGGVQVLTHIVSLTGGGGVQFLTHNVSLTGGGGGTVSHLHCVVDWCRGWGWSQKQQSAQQCKVSGAVGRTYPPSSFVSFSVLVDR